MLAHRLRSWDSIGPALDDCIVFADRLDQYWLASSEELVIGVKKPSVYKQWCGVVRDVNVTVT